MRNDLNVGMTTKRKVKLSQNIGSSDTSLKNKNKLPTPPYSPFPRPSTFFTTQKRIKLVYGSIQTLTCYQICYGQITFKSFIFHFLINFYYRKTFGNLESYLQNILPNSMFTRVSSIDGKSKASSSNKIK